MQRRKQSYVLWMRLKYDSQIFESNLSFEIRYDIRNDDNN